MSELGVSQAATEANYSILNLVISSKKLNNWYVVLTNEKKRRITGFFGLKIFLVFTFKKKFDYIVEFHDTGDLKVFFEGSWKILQKIII